MNITIMGSGGIGGYIGDDSLLAVPMSFSSHEVLTSKHSKRVG